MIGSIGRRKKMKEKYAKRPTYSMKDKGKPNKMTDLVGSTLGASGHLNLFREIMDQVKTLRAEVYHSVQSSRFGNEFEFARQVVDPKPNHDYQSTLMDFGTDLFDSDPITTIDRVHAGLLSYHYSTTTDFVSFLLTGEGQKEESIDVIKEYASYNKSFNALLQSPTNAVEYGTYLKSKIIYPLAAIEVVGEEGLRLRAIPNPEGIISYSSDNRVIDVQGYMEQLTYAELRARYFIDDILSEENNEDRQIPQLFQTESFFDSNKLDYIRVCMPVTVFRDMIKGERRSQDGEMLLTYFESLKDEDFIDIHYCDEVILHLEKVNRSLVFTSSFLSGTDSTRPGMSLLQKARGVVVSLNEMFERNTYAFNEYATTRHFYTDPGAAFDYDPDVSAFVPVRDGSDFKLTHDFIPKDLNSLQLSVEKKREAFHRAFFADIFDPYTKNRMTTTEVERDMQNGFRRLGPFLTRETRDFLLPVSSIFLERHAKKIGREPEHELMPIYISPIAEAQRDTIVNRNMKLATAAVELAKSNPSEAAGILTRVDFGDVLTSTFREAGGVQFLRGEGEAQKLQQALEKEANDAKRRARLKDLGQIQGQLPGGEGETPPTPAGPPGIEQ